MKILYKSIPLTIFAFSCIFAQVRLLVNTIPKRVEIFLDGQSLGKTPINSGKISIGEHQFKIIKEGYAPLTYDLLVNPAEAVKLDFFLNPIYKIQFKTDQNGLIFELNDVHRWEDKIIRLQLEAGEHFLRVFKLGEVIDEQTITVDEPKTFNYFLNKPISKE